MPLMSQTATLFSTSSGESTLPGTLADSPVLKHTATRILLIVKAQHRLLRSASKQQYASSTSKRVRSLSVLKRTARSSLHQAVAVASTALHAAWHSEQVIIARTSAVTIPLPWAGQLGWHVSNVLRILSWQITTQACFDAAKRRAALMLPL